MITFSKLGVSLVLAMVLPFLASLGYFVVLSDSSVSQVAYSGTKIFTLLWPIIVYQAFLRDKKISVPFFSRSRSVVIEGFFSGFLILTAILLLAWLALPEVVNQAAPQIEAKIDQLGLREHFLLFSIFLCLIHSLLEEYYWRWFVFGHLKEFASGFKTHLLASLAFTAHHLVILSQFVSAGWVLFGGLAVFIGGLTWSFLYERHQSLLGAWISHALADVALMMIAWDLLRSA